ncbi:AMP-binding protein [Pseudonocardia sichuanensis]
MGLPLTIDHLLWRMEHVHRDAQVVGVPGAASRPVPRTFTETAAGARRLATALHRHHGITAGSTVAVMAFNTVEHFALMLAVPTLGAAVNSLNVRLSADALVRQARDHGPDLLVVDDEVTLHPSIGPAARCAVEDLTRRGVPVLRANGAGLASVAALMAQGATTFDGPEPPEDATAFYFHTSGTTGPAKTYAVTHRDVVLHALTQATVDASGLRRGDRVLPLAPFFHVNGWGLPFTAAVTGSSLVLVGGDLGAARIAEILSAQRVTVAAAVPTVWFDVCRLVAGEPRLRPAVLREVLSGGSAVPQSVVELVERELGARVATAWGMTETMACSTYEREAPSRSAGRFVPLVEARIAGEDGEGTTAGAGERGRLQVRGAFVVGGPRAPSGWLDTEDIASLDQEGRLHLHDRSKDLIKSGGEWIASAEIEQHLCTHPAVSNAAVVARPDPRWGERPVAFVVRSAEAPAAVEPELRRYLAERFPRFWLPDVITIVDRLPVTAVGKVDKRALRAHCRVNEGVA